MKEKPSWGWYDPGLRTRWAEAVQTRPERESLHQIRLRAYHVILRLSLAARARRSSSVKCYLQAEYKDVFKIEEERNVPALFPVIYRLLFISLSRQFLHVNLGFGTRVRGPSSCIV